MGDLESFFNEHYARLLGIVERRINPRLRTRKLPEDILQDAFIVVQRRWPKLNENPDKQNFSTLYMIAIDCLREAWRTETRGMRDVRKELPWPDNSYADLGSRLASPGTTPTQHLAQVDLTQRVRAAMDALGEGQSDVIHMRYYEELSYCEIGKVLDISEGAATLRCVRALEKLQRVFKQLTDESLS